MIPRVCIIYVLRVLCDNSQIPSLELNIILNAKNLLVVPPC